MRQSFVCFYGVQNNGRKKLQVFFFDIRWHYLTADNLIVPKQARQTGVLVRFYIWFVPVPASMG